MGISTANLLTKKTYDEMKEVIRETTEARFGAVVEAIQKSYEMQGYKFTNDGNQLERIYKEAVGDKYRKQYASALAIKRLREIEEQKAKEAAEEAAKHKGKRAARAEAKIAMKATDIGIKKKP